MTVASTQPPTGRTDKVFYFHSRKTPRESTAAGWTLSSPLTRLGWRPDVPTITQTRIVRGARFMMNSCLTSALFRPPRPTNSGARAESNVGAEPHLGTLPSLKQIRPQRLIKTLHVQGFMDEGAPKRGAIARPPSAPPTMNLHSTGCCVFRFFFD